MGRPLANLLGQRFGRIVVIERAHSSAGASRWLCICDCGVEKVVAASSLKSGDTRSCGCLNKEVTSARAKIDKVTHGQSGTTLYIVWQSMKRRCHDPRTDAHKYYGARGISVCQEWRHSFGSFYRWAISNGYCRGLTIDRHNNDGNYSPSNCRWVTPLKQANNRRNNRHITINGKTKTISEWASIYCLPATTVHQRIRNGWPLDRALTEPIRRT